MLREEYVQLRLLEALNAQLLQARATSRYSSGVLNHARQRIDVDTAPPQQLTHRLRNQ
ncbi:hypothetical protein ACF07V_05505 [Streptomyces sp. NPDC015661]|uniref:hypothetical protein n=1 Tax=Streptomyces sp. NPDC015661 TaxID=3364961 RepID=UPI0036F5036F